MTPRFLPVWLLALGAFAPACQDQVPLGAWTSGGESGAAVGGSSGAAGTGGANASTPLPVCLEPAAPTMVSPVGSGIAVTETATDWTWPSPVASMQWELMVEREIQRPTPSSGPVSGYYWAHQFSFEEGVAGFLGIQAEGGYQLDPPSSPVEFTKIAVFWLSGPPLAGELGDIPYPNARVAPMSASGVNYLTIHARFAWQACRTYRLRVAPHSTEANGSTWYGAWIEDRTSGTETFLGRMLLPADTGLLSPFSVFRSIPIVFGEPTSCEAPIEASAIFGRPSAVGGGMAPILRTNRFVDPGRCPTSQLTDFPGAVRHELAVRQ